MCPISIGSSVRVGTSALCVHLRKELRVEHADVKVTLMERPESLKQRWAAVDALPSHQLCLGLSALGCLLSHWNVLPPSTALPPSKAE